MRIAMLVAPAAPGGRPSRHLAICDAYANGADPRGLPLLLEDRIADGAAFAGERIVRLPRRFSRGHLGHVGWMLDDATREMRS